MAKRSNWIGRKITQDYRRNRELVIRRDQGCCVRCQTLFGLITMGEEVDHFIPVSKGGSDDLNNIWLLCGDCHFEKTQRESNGHILFKSRIGLDGFPIEEPDWQNLIADRNRKFFDP